ncbi:MAG: arginine--tRNA ligase [Nanoarchaeota archaeon]|nr:arginine--tRNA ligase [Nanoarchaeota archaeon]
MNFKEEIIALLAKETKLAEEDLANLLAVPSDPKLGDYAFPCFRLGKNAKEEAEKMKGKLKLPHFVAKAEVAGPYLNFFLKNKVVVEETLSHIYQEQKEFGKQNLGKGKKIIVEFSSPNIAKPFGIGHLRSTVIGSSLYKVYRALGYDVFGVNHLGDWGTQFGKLIVAYRKWGSEDELQQEPIKYLLHLYVKFHQEAEKDKSLEDEARAEFKRLEDGDKESIVLWEKFKGLSLREFQRIYKILDVNFDSLHGEGFYNNLLESSIKELQQKVKTALSDGALIVDLEKYNMPPFMLRKSDGASTYHTRDLAAALYRLKKYRPEKVMYVVGSEQKLHFQQLFKVLELAGFDKDKFIHVDFGLFRFPEGKMSTRKGQVIFLEEVLDRAIDLAEKIIEEKNPTLQNKAEVAVMVGVGAIIFADLSNDRIRDIDFDWNRMLSFEGETAPYLQYTHARACSILRKAVKEHQLGVSPHVNFELFTQAEEMAVVKRLYAYPEMIEKVALANKPHHLAHYLIALAQAFNEFYHQCLVLSDDKNQTKARLLLVDCVRQVLENGLNLLGIQAPEEM